MKNFKSYDEFLNEGDEGNAQMAFGQLERIIDYATMLRDRLKGEEVIPAWAASKITLAEHGLDAVYGYMDGKDGVVESEELDEYAEAGPNALKGVGYKDAAIAKETVKKLDKLIKKDRSHAMSIATSMETKAKSHQNKTKDMDAAAKVFREWIDKNKLSK